jgi:hypothetical protein
VRLFCPDRVLFELLCCPEGRVLLDSRDLCSDDRCSEDRCPDFSCDRFSRDRDFSCDFWDRDGEVVREMINGDIPFVCSSSFVFPIHVGLVMRTVLSFRQLPVYNSATMVADSPVE